MSDNEGGTPPAGWYDDPGSPGTLRWWDGMAWTDHRRAGTGTPPPGATPWAGGGGPAAPTWRGGPTAAGGAAVAADPVDPWLWQSILATIFCCQPLGIVAIVFAAQAQSAVSSGDLNTAREKAATARTWTLVAASFGLVVVAFFVLFAFSGVFMAF